MVHMSEIWMKARFPLMIGIGILCAITIISFFVHSFGGGFQKDESHDKLENHTAPDGDAGVMPAELQRVIDEKWKMIRESMDGYEYPRGKYNVNAEKLDDLLISENGKPIRSVILSTWRSGSTFFGAIIDAHPANFYHYEPLLDFQISQIRGPPLDADALKRVKALFNCNYTDQEKYVEYFKNDSTIFEYNRYFWELCKVNRTSCYNIKFLSEMCKLFPFQSMKLVRLRLSVAQHLLEDESLNVRMVLLVRDPRGTVQSRNHSEWCPNKPDCWDPALLCADLSSDYKIAKELLKKYPTRFRVIRYEDLSAAPYERAEELTQFYGLNFHANIKQYLDTHTKRNAGDAWSTYRDTKSAPYHWKTELTFEEVDEIQRYCLPAMEQWGYSRAMNATHQKTFDPVTEYNLDSVETVVPAPNPSHRASFIHQ